MNESRSLQSLAANKNNLLREGNSKYIPMRINQLTAVHSMQSNTQNGMSGLNVKVHQEA